MYRILQINYKGTILAGKMTTEIVIIGGKKLLARLMEA